VIFDERNGVELAFVDADVRRIVDAIMGETLRLNYSVDPKIQGTLTLRTARPVARGSLLSLLESTLSTIDAAIVKNGAIYEVVPLSGARDRVANGSLSSAAERGQPGYAIEAIPLRYASVREVARVLEQVVSKQAILSNDPLYNQLIIAGTGPERSSIRRLISSLDVDWLNGMSFAIYKLEHVDPQTLADDFVKIFAPPIDLLGTRVRLVPIPRLRSILGIARSRDDLQRLEPWVRRFDAGGSSAQRTLYSYAVQNGRAAEVAQSLQQVVNGIMPDISTANIAPSVGIQSAGSMANGGSSSLGRGSSLAISGNSGFASSTVAPSGLGTRDYGGSGNGPRIVPNDVTNALLIYATGEEYQLIRDVLSQIDRPAQQVLIEAILAEVTLGDDLRYGLQWTVTGGQNTFTLSDAGSAQPGSIFPGFSYVYSGQDARVVLNTLQSRTNVRVLSAPKLVVLNNQTATLQVGDQVPIVSQSAVGVASPGAPIVNQVEMRDTGVILRVTPRVNESGLVVMDVAQEVSDVAQTTSSGIDSPTIQQRKFSSTISTRDGQMIALGGLIRENASIGKRGLPLLSRVPGFGGLFGTHTTSGRRTELIVLLTPRLMRDAHEQKLVIEGLIDELDAARPLVEQGLKAQVHIDGAQTGESPLP